jgi:hypothetical protein
MKPFLYLCGHQYRTPLSSERDCMKRPLSRAQIAASPCPRCQVIFSPVPATALVRGIVAKDGRFLENPASLAKDGRVTIIPQTVVVDGDDEGGGEGCRITLPKHYYPFSIAIKRQGQRGPEYEVIFRSEVPASCQS